MEPTTRSRSELKSYFVRNAIPTEGNFAELVDGLINQKDDRILKQPDSPLSLEGIGTNDTSQKPVLRLYRDFSSDTADWTLKLKNEKGNPGFNLADEKDISRLFIDQGSGNVGVGTSNPNAKLTVDGNIVGSNVSVARTNNERGALFLATLGDFNHALYNNIANLDGTRSWDGAKWNVFQGLDIRTGGGAAKRTALYINNTSNIGIGTTVPQHKLQIGDASTPVGISLRGPDLSAASSYLAFEDNAGTQNQWFRLVHDTNSNKLILRSTEVSSILGIDRSTGNVGIGSPSPSYQLQVTRASLNNWQARFTNGTANVYLNHGSGYGIHINTGQSNNSSRYALEVRNNNNRHLYVRDDGNIGIGTATPSSKLHIHHTSNNPVIITGGASNNNAKTMLASLPNSTLIIGGPWRDNLYFYWKDDLGRVYRHLLKGSSF